jgi:PIN domain nuclease of toxin-antitoxin system
VIVLDTHIWVWLTSQPDCISRHHRQILQASEAHSLGVSVISCWEVAKLVEYGRLELGCPVFDWIEEALAAPGIVLIPLSPRIVVESTALPAPFHRDPADQLLVATARILGCPLMSDDAKIAAYPHVQHP